MNKEQQVYGHDITIDSFRDDYNKLIGIVTPSKSRRSELLGKRIQRLAEQHNITMETVALLLWCSEEYVTQLYNGKAFLSYPRFQILAKSLGVDIIELLTVNESEATKCD